MEHSESKCLLVLNYFIYHSGKGFCIFHWESKDADPDPLDIQYTVYSTYVLTRSGSWIQLRFCQYQTIKSFKTYFL